MPLVLLDAGTSREVGFAPLEDYSWSANRAHFQNRVPHGLCLLLGCTDYIIWELLITKRIFGHAIGWLVTSLSLWRFGSIPGRLKCNLWFTLSFLPVTELQNKNWANNLCIIIYFHMVYIHIYIM